MSSDALTRWLRKDLTRWHRAGLTTLDYSDANAADFLETFRIIWRNKFPDLWRERLEPEFEAEQLLAEEPGLDQEEFARRTINEQLVKRYFATRGDISWELARSFARSCHVLNQHINAHVNEAYFRTAESWEDLRKMVALLGYQPAGPTSAQTEAAIMARGSGLVKKGLQLRHRPKDGSSPIIFESLEDIEVNEDLNFFEAKNKHISDTVLEEAENLVNNRDPEVQNNETFKSPWRENPKTPLNRSDSCLIVHNHEDRADAAWILNKHNNRLQLAHESDRWKEWQLGQVKLSSSPRFRRQAWINGHRVRRSRKPHGFSAGEVIAWRKQGEESPQKWRFARIERADNYGLILAPHLDEFSEAQYSSVDENGNAIELNAYENDEHWPNWNNGDSLEIRKATRITGSIVLHAGSLAEKYIGSLSNYTAGDLLTWKPGPEDTSETQLKFPIEKLEEPQDIVANKLTTFQKRDPPEEGEDWWEFILWLFKVANIATSFPISPKVLVQLATMLLVDEARIPSTGQRVYEAFLKIFGGNAGSKPWKDPSQQPLPLFRFWVEKKETSDEGEEGGGGGGEDSPPPPAKVPDFPFNLTGEIWYLPADSEYQEGYKPEIFLADNQHDSFWYFFDGKSNGLKEGQWAAARFANNIPGLSLPHLPRWQAVKIIAIEPTLNDSGEENTPEKRYQNDNAFALRLQLPPEVKNTFSGTMPIPELLELQTDYRTTEAGEGANTPSTRAIEGDNLALKPCPKKSLLGRTLLVSNGEGKAQKISVTDVDEDTCSIRFSPLLESQYFNEGNIQVFGNIVRTGHGKQQSPTLLGVDNSNAENSVLLKQPNISTVSDTRINRGAREDIEVRINGKKWQQKSQLNFSTETDPHFTTSVTEEGFLNIVFGDGLNGRKIPAGTNNIEVLYRVGAGEKGSNLPPHSLEELIQAHPLVDAVIQSQVTVGGADMEKPEEMRERAPASLLALERAVSLRDFEQLALQHRSITHAKAVYESAAIACLDSITIFAATTGGAELSVAMQNEVAQHLQSRALPTVKIRVKNINVVEASLYFSARIDSQSYEADSIKKQLTKTLLSQFSADKRQPGQDLKTSEVYAVMESVAGVKNSIISEILPQRTCKAKELFALVSETNLHFSLEPDHG